MKCISRGINLFAITFTALSTPDFVEAWYTFAWRKLPNNSFNKYYTKLDTRINVRIKNTQELYLFSGANASINFTNEISG